MSELFAQMNSTIKVIRRIQNMTDEQKRIIDVISTEPYTDENLIIFFGVVSEIINTLLDESRENQIKFDEKIGEIRAENLNLMERYENEIKHSKKLKEQTLKLLKKYNKNKALFDQLKQDIKSGKTSSSIYNLQNKVQQLTKALEIVNERTNNNVEELEKRNVQLEEEIAFLKLSENITDPILTRTYEKEIKILSDKVNNLKEKLKEKEELIKRYEQENHSKSSLSNGSFTSEYFKEKLLKKQIKIQNLKEDILVQERKVLELSQENNSLMIESRKLKIKNEALIVEKQQLNDLISGLGLDHKNLVVKRKDSLFQNANTYTLQQRENIRLATELQKVKEKLITSEKTIQQLRTEGLTPDKYGYLLAEAINESYNPRNAEVELVRLIDIAREQHDLLVSSIRVPVSSYKKLVV